MESIKGVLFGLVLFFGAFAVLFWNEGRAVKTAKALEEGSNTVQTVSIDEVSESNDGKLVHVTGRATTPDTLTDESFGVSFHGIKLSRVVEMYQWKENQSSKTEKKLGGSEETVTTYDYVKDWSSSLIRSNEFKIKEGHTNPDRFLYEARKYAAEDVSLGTFKLSGSLIGGINKSQALMVESIDTILVPKSTIISGTVYIGSRNASNPKIGDMRVSFAQVGEMDVSIVAQQVANTFEPYVAENGEQVELLEIGTVSAKLMFANAQASNKIMTWVLRLVGFVMMFGGLTMIFSPLVVFADVIPFLGTILSMGLSLFAGIISLTLSFITISIAWLVYRPIVGIVLIIVGVGIFAGIKYLADKKKKSQSPPPGEEVTQSSE
jgi:hypothetical protein